MAIKKKLFVPSLAWWMLAWSYGICGDDSLNPDFASVRSTVHNMSPGREPDDLCVFCHTPTTSSDDTIVPKWQAAFSDPFFQTSNRSKDKNATAGSVSIMCLACHTPDASLLNGLRSNVPFMQDQHPIGIPYAGVVEGGKGGNLDYGIARKGRYNDGNVWWVETGNPGFQADDILLFPRFLDDNSVVPFVECASCHDPHSTNRKFIRIPDPERLCQACHPNWF
ncbi:MAG: cytochrome c3 family protein [Magnetococcales bacterium]|nr:cytochrome c3 family protein [Magnetococcales bacterium]